MSYGDISKIKNQISKNKILIFNAGIKTIDKI